MLKRMSRRKFIGTSLGAAVGMGLVQSSGSALGASRACADADSGTKDKSLDQSYSEKKEATKMLYVVNCELKGGYPLPAEQWLEIVAKGMDTVMEYKKQGKILLHVGLVGRQAGCMVWNVDSNDELQRLLAPLPFWPFMEWEIIPALSTEQTIESVKQAQAAVRSSKK